jgi:hypothetical protein
LPHNITILSYIFIYIIVYHCLLFYILYYFILYMILYYISFHIIYHSVSLSLYIPAGMDVDEEPAKAGDAAAAEGSADKAEDGAAAGKEGGEGSEKKEKKEKEPSSYTLTAPCRVVPQQVKHVSFPQGKGEKGMLGVVLIVLSAPLAVSSQSGVGACSAEVGTTLS